MLVLWPLDSSRQSWSSVCMPHADKEGSTDSWSQNWLAGLCAPAPMAQTRWLKPEQQSGKGPDPGAKNRMQSPDLQSRVLSTPPAYNQGSLTKGPGENTGPTSHPTRTKAPSPRRHVYFKPLMWMLLKLRLPALSLNCKAESFIAWTQERQRCQIRGRDSPYYQSLKSASAEVT